MTLRQLNKEDLELVRQVSSDFHGTVPRSARHGSFSDSLALTHCICWGAAYRAIASIRLREHVFESLGKALNNGYDARLVTTEVMANDMCTYDPDLEDIDPELLHPHIEAWKKRIK